MNVTIDTHNHVHTRLVRYRLQLPTAIQPVKDPTPWPTSKFAKAVHFTFLVLPFTMPTGTMTDSFSHDHVDHGTDFEHPSTSDDHKLSGTETGRRTNARGGHHRDQTHQRSSGYSRSPHHRDQKGTSARQSFVSSGLEVVEDAVDKATPSLSATIAGS